MWAKISGEEMWAAMSRRLRSFQAGSVPWNTPGVSGAPYQPTPKPSPFRVVAPSRECLLWSISEWTGLTSSSSSNTGEPE